MAGLQVLFHNRAIGHVKDIAVFSHFIIKDTAVLFQILLHSNTLSEDRSKAAWPVLVFREGVAASFTDLKQYRRVFYI